jgi:hypothetical protein
MSVPPPPNQWGSQSAAGGQPVGPTQWGPPPGGQPGGPQWSPQQPWGQPPGPPPGRGKGKWIFGGIAILAVIAVTVVITVLVVSKDSDNSPNPTPTNGNGSDLASANDKGPVGIITDEPTCNAWNRIADTYVATETSAGWSNRDSSVPASAWTTDQRTMYETVGKAMNNAADQTVSLVNVTPHRVVRELYEQFIAYARAFNDSLPQYKPEDNYVAGVVDGIEGALVNICAAITYGAAATQAPFVPEAAAPSEVSAPEDPANPKRFITRTDPICSEWISAYEKFDADTADWRKMDPNIPAAQWNPEQKAVVDAAAPVMTAFADNSEQLGRSSNNPTVQDFATLSAQYRRAIVKALPNYTPADNYLSEVSTLLAMTINPACKAVGG